MDGGTSPCIRGPIDGNTTERSLDTGERLEFGGLLIKRLGDYLLEDPKDININ